MPIPFALLFPSVSLLFLVQASAQVTMSPLASFGVNGWIAPGTSSPYLTTGNTERGLAYNQQTGNLVLVARQDVAGVSNNVRILSGTTGADLGGLVNTGLTGGGTFLVNMAGVGDDGIIYVANLSTSVAQNFTVYAWTSEAAGLTTAPFIFFTASTTLGRTGDSFAVTGTFPTAQFAAAGSNAVSASNFALGSLDQSNSFTAYLSVPGTSAGTNDYRLGMTFVDPSTVIGTQGNLGRLTTISGATAIVTASIPLGGAPRRAVDYAVIGSTPVLAVIDTNSSFVTVLDIRDPLNPLTMASATTTSGTLSANGNGTGSVAWGAITGNTAVLYAMSSNQGVQAFQVTFNPLAGAANYGAGCDGYAINAVGVPAIGNVAFQMDVSSPALLLLPVAFVAFGSFGIPGGFDLSSFGMGGCFSYTSFDLGMFGTGPVAGGIGSFPLPIPNNLGLAGATLAAQGVGLSLTTSAGLAASNGLALTIGF